jgi:hypothetical protein
MRPLTRTFVVATLLLLPLTASAQTLTIRDLVALHNAGLGDEVLIAMIEVDKPVFTLFPADVLDLRKQGLTDRVIVKMIETRRIVAPAPPAPVVPVEAPAPAPAPSRDEAQPADDPAPRSRASSPPPVIVEQTVVQEVRVEAPRHREPEYVQVPVYVPVAVRPRIPEKEPEPVYWGFGGQRRPGTWQDPPKPTTAPKPTTGGGGGF